MTLASASVRRPPVNRSVDLSKAAAFIRVLGPYSPRLRRVSMNRAAAAKLALEHAAQKLGAGQPLYIAGYSTGAAIALDLVVGGADGPPTGR